MPIKKEDGSDGLLSKKGAIEEGGHNLSNFKGLPYRDKILVNNKNLIIINNSKATNVEAAYKSLQNYNNVILILGV